MHRVELWNVWQKTDSGIVWRGKYEGKDPEEAILNRHKKHSNLQGYSHSNLYVQGDASLSALIGPFEVVPPEVPQAVVRRMGEDN